MKNIVTIFLLISGYCYPQDFWVQTNGPRGASVAAFLEDSTGRLYAGSNNGIYVSTNAGITWSKLGLDNLHIRALAAKQNGLMFAGTTNEFLRSTNYGYNWIEISQASFVRTIALNAAGHVFAGTAYGGVYKSTNDGNNWTSLQGPSNNVTVLLIKGIYIFCGTLNNGLYRSTNNGNNWTQLGFQNPNVYALAVDSAGSIYAGGGAAVYKSTDNGNSWFLSNNGINGGQITCLLTSDQNHLFASTEFRGVYRSTDNGISWLNVNNGFFAYWIETLFQDRAGNLFAGTYSSDGVYFSSNFGNDWSIRNDGINNSNVYSLALDFQGTLYAGVYNSGIHKTTDMGKNWIKTNLRILTSNILDFNSLAITPDNNILVGSEWGTVYLSTNGGLSWRKIMSRLFTCDVTCIGVSHSNYIFVSGGNCGVYRSTNNGLNWTPNFNPSAVTDFAVNRLGHIYAATYSGIYRTTNDGDNWTHISGLSAWSLAFDSSSIIYAASEIQYPPGRGGIFKSIDNGSNWVPVGMNSVPFSTVLVDSNHYVYASTYWYGVYVSTNSGMNWSTMNGGLTTHGVTTLALDALGNFYAGTGGRGVFRSYNYPIGIKGNSTIIKGDYKLHQNYPNPFNPVTLIKFSVPSSKGVRGMTVRLLIYDVLGREVETLLNKPLPPGAYEIDWDGTNYPSGVYFYKLTAGEFFESKRMILLK